ncbi:MAG: hypothetical protein AABZ30_11675 [Myxococcota bacterium]
MPPADARPAALARPFLRLDPDTLIAMRAEARRDAERSRMIYIDDDGTTRVVDVKLRPRAIRREQHAYLARLTQAVVRAQRRVARIFFHEPALREVLPLEPREEEVLRELHTRRALDGPILGRIDTNTPLGDPDWRRAIRIFEVNSVGVGGIDYVVSTERIVAAGLALRPSGGRLRAGPDLRDHLLRAIVAHARSLGAPRPSIALVEERTPGGTLELEAFRDHFRARGFRTVIADPREVESRPRGLYAAGTRVDIVYRDIELRDLLALDGGAADVAGMLRAFAERRVLSAPCAELDHKSLLEVFTDTRWAGLFAAADLRLLRAHALWTRLLFERVTTSWDGPTVDLEKLVRSRRRELVLKPNRSFGGKGVVLGRHVGAREWQRAVDAALARPASCVVQRFARIPREPFPSSTGPARMERQFADLGLYAFGARIGFLSRASTSPIVNISSGGGIAAVLRA